jgi:DNA-binding GntR family transcriptional regulator
MPPKSKDDIYNIIFNRIMDGDYINGTRLKEASLAEEFQVSRTPIREVLQLLSQDGMVHLAPNRGATVHPLTPDDIEEIYEIRKSLELMAIDFAITKCNLQQLGRFKERILELTADSGLAESSALDRDLHKYILDLSGKKRLISMVDQLLRLMQRFRYIGFHIPQVSERVRFEHLAMIDALLDRDAALARKCLVAHIDNSKKATLQFIFNKRFRNLP